MPAARAQTGIQEDPMRRYLLALALALLIPGTGCGSHTAGFDYTLLKNRCQGDFHLESGDVIRVNVWNEPNHSRDQVLIRPDGMFSLPLVGEFRAAGRTLAVLTAEVQEKLKTLLPNPRVDISLVNQRSYQVFVMGEVQRSGPFTAQAPMDVLQALARAGGLSPYAKRDKIFIIWKGPAGEQRIPFNYEEVMAGIRPEQNIILCRGDMLLVP